MDNISDLEKDALVLLKKINSSFPRENKWLVLNLARSKKRRFNLNPPHHVFPQCFGYSLESVPQLLVDRGVIVAMDKLWFLSITKNETPSKRRQTGNIFLIGKENGFLNEQNEVNFYLKVYRDRVDYGPVIPGHVSVLINAEKMRSFIDYYSAEKPFFNNADNSLNFMNQKIIFSGDVEIVGIKFLLKNINRMVSRKDFYQANGDNNYDRIKKQEELTQLHDTIDKRFNQIKDRVNSNEILKNQLIFVKQNGFFGLFINRRIWSELDSMALDS